MDTATFAFESIISDIQKQIVCNLIDQNEIGRKCRLKNLLSFRLVSKRCRDLSISFVGVKIKLDLSESNMSWTEISDYIHQYTFSANILKAVSFRSPLQEGIIGPIWKSLSQETFANLTEIHIQENTSVNDEDIHCLPPQLTSLILQDCRKITFKAIRHIRDHLPKLISLNIFSYAHSLTDTALSYLPLGLTQLKLGYLDEVTNEGVKYLGNLTRLVNLEVSLGSNCTSECIGFLPRSLTRLVYYRDDNCMDDKGVPLLPPKLQILRIAGDGSCPDLSTDSLSKLPETITFLDMRAARIVVNNLHSNITQLTLWRFYDKMTVLPPKLEFLAVDVIDNRPAFAKLLPSSLKVLMVGSAGNLELKDLPRSLTHFEVKAIEGSLMDFADLPRGLLFLKGGCLDNNVEELPPKLIKLGIRTTELTFQGAQKIPASVRCLTLYKNVDDDYKNCFARDFRNIPATVSHLKLNRITIWKNLQPDQFPGTIQRLCVNSFEPLETIPTTIKELKTDRSYLTQKKKTKGLKVKMLQQIDSDDEEEKEHNSLRSFSAKIINTIHKQK